MDEAKVLILSIVDNKLFDQLFISMKQDVASKMMETFDLEALVFLRDEGRALDRLQGKLTEIANEIRMLR